MKYISKPLNNEIEVYINFIDEKVNEDKPFTYYDVTTKKKEIPLKELKKDFRLKLKKNKKINDDSYFITLKGFKDFKISANYSEHSNITTVFFKPQKAWYKINKIVFNYQDQKEKKLEKLKEKMSEVMNKSELPNDIDPNFVNEMYLKIIKDFFQ